MMIEIVDLPSYKMVIFHSFLYVYSWVIGSFYIFWPIPMSCGSATGTWFGNVNEVRNPTVVVKNFLACSGHRLLADDSVHMLWYQLISTRLFLCIFKVQQFRPWQMFVELIYIYIIITTITIIHFESSAALPPIVHDCCLGPWALRRCDVKALCVTRLGAGWTWFRSQIFSECKGLW